MVVGVVERRAGVQVEIGQTAHARGTCEQLVMFTDAAAVLLVVTGEQNGDGV